MVKECFTIQILTVMQNIVATKSAVLISERATILIGLRKRLLTTLPADHTNQFHQSTKREIIWETGK